jgi:hypothetical protein
VALDFEYKYFRAENDQFFRDFSQKNGVKASASIKKAGGSSVPEVKKPKDPLVESV